MKSKQTHLNTLLARLVDESISDQELTELDSLLLDDPEAQKHYFHYLGLHQDLSDKVGSIPDETPARRSMTQAMLWPTATLLAAAIGIMLWIKFDAKPIAEIVDFGGPVRWVKQDGQIIRELEPGFSIQKGWIETMGADSWAEVRFPDATRIQVSGMAKLHIAAVKNQKQLNLTTGNISVEAAAQPAGKPLLLTTAAAEAEVLGTQFNVVASDYSTHLEVNEGLVKVKRLADGLTEEVKPNHQVIAALESDTEFVARPRKQSASQWSSQLPRDILQGRLTERGTVRAETHLWRGDKSLNETLEQPVLLHSVVLTPSAKRMPPLNIESGQRLIISGKLTKPELINIGFATHRRKGGFSGKYMTWRRAEAGSFTYEIPLSKIKPNRESFPKSSVDHKMCYIWIQTVKSDAGLEVEHVTISK